LKGSLNRREALFAGLAGGAFLAGPARGHSAVPPPPEVSAWILWYRQPAARWVEALPVGNGRLGAMVFGGAAIERLQLNEDSFWAGGPYDPTNPDAREALPRVRAPILEGREAEAQSLANEKLMARPLRQMSYQTLGEMLIETPGHDDPDEYRRWLDLDGAVAAGEWRTGGRRFRRSVFASAPDRAIVVRFEALDGGPASWSVRFAAGSAHAIGDTLVQTGRNREEHGISGALRYAVMVQALNGPGRIDGERLIVSLCAGPAMDRQILRELFANIIDASRRLGRDATLRAQFAQALARIPADRIGKAGQLQEWLEDWDLDAPEIQHRHVSHLYALYPAHEIGPAGVALFKAARRSLELRGDDATGWGIGWRLNLWARLGDGERAYAVLRKLLGPDRTYPNMFDAHPPFQIDGNFGGAAGIVEMLVRDQPQGVMLLPALPTAWPSGRPRGVRLRGGLTMDLSWRDGRLAKAAITAADAVERRFQDGDTVHRLSFGRRQRREIDGTAG
jgi:hypothetical protein